MTTCTRRTRRRAVRLLVVLVVTVPLADRTDVLAALAVGQAHAVFGARVRFLPIHRAVALPAAVWTNQPKEGVIP